MESYVELVRFCETISNYWSTEHRVKLQAFNVQCSSPVKSLEMSGDGQGHVSIFYLPIYVSQCLLMPSSWIQWEWSTHPTRTIQVLDLSLFATPLKLFLACAFIVPESLAAHNAIAIMLELHNATARRSWASPNQNSHAYPFPLTTTITTTSVHVMSLFPVFLPFGHYFCHAMCYMRLLSP